MDKFADGRESDDFHVRHSTFVVKNVPDYSQGGDGGVGGVGPPSGLGEVCHLTRSNNK